MGPMREEDDGKAASGWEGARRLTRLSGVVMGCGFFGPAPPPQYPASDHHGRWRGEDGRRYVSILWQQAIVHACGRDRCRFLCFRSLIPSKQTVQCSMFSLLLFVKPALALVFLTGCLFISPATTTDVPLQPRTLPPPTSAGRTPA